MKKFLITEQQLRFLIEQQGLNEFFQQMSETYPDSVYMMQYIKEFIEKSGCKNISVDNFRLQAYGLSTMNGVVLNTSAFTTPYSTFLYILFHEIAHQYQYKKYGIDKMYACYTGDMDIDDAAVWMKNVENVADEFAIRKIREAKKKFESRIKLNDIKHKIYQDAPIGQFKHLIQTFISKIKEKGYTDKNEISEILFNYVKNG